MFTSGDQKTLQEAWNALLAVTKNLDPSDLMVYVSDVRQVCSGLQRNFYFSLYLTSSTLLIISEL